MKIDCIFYLSRHLSYKTHYINGQTLWANYSHELQCLVIKKVSAFACLDLMRFQEANIFIHIQSIFIVFDTMLSVYIKTMFRIP